VTLVAAVTIWSRAIQSDLRKYGRTTRTVAICHFDHCSGVAPTRCRTRSAREEEEEEEKEEEEQQQQEEQEQEQEQEEEAPIKRRVCG